jgi:hypothetical protein
VLPTGGHDLRIFDRADREFRVPADDAYWITVAERVDMAWTTSDGDDRNPPFRHTET